MRVPLRWLAIVVLGDLLTLLGMWGSWQLTSAFSLWLLHRGWTISAFGGLGFSIPLENGNWQDALAFGIAQLFTLFLLVLFQYGLSLMGWKLLRGRLRMTRRRVLRSLAISALVAPVALLLAVTIVDGSIMVIAHTGIIDLPTGVITWILYFVVAPVLLHRLLLLRRSKRVKPLCRRCGYNLTGNVSGVCPECGAETGRRVTA
jgi:hypothetical protein